LSAKGALEYYWLISNSVSDLICDVQELSTPPTGGVHPKTFFDTTTPPQTGGVKSSYTYTDRVYAIFNYRRLLQ